MSDLFDFLTKTNPDDANEDLSLEKIIKKWENDVLSGPNGNQDSWSYSMESDPDFANAQQNENMSSDQILKLLFNSDLPNSTLKTQFINRKTTELVTEPVETRSTKPDETRSTKSRYSLSIHRSCDTVENLVYALN